MHFQTKFLPRQQYFVFRFEDSLRKYEPAPRKKVKLTQQECNHCHKKRISQSKESRISRLCATRKKYHQQSRQGASSFSKIKETSLDKKNILVSDFMSDAWTYQAEEIKIRNKLQQHEHSQSMKKLLEKPDSISNSKQNELRQQIEVSEKMQGQQYGKMRSVKRRETLIKEEIKQKMQREQKKIKEELMMSEQRRVDKIRDIDFHIKMVSQLHQSFLMQHRVSSSHKSVEWDPEECLIEEQQAGKQQLKDVCGQGQIQKNLELSNSSSKQLSRSVQGNLTDQVNEFQESGSPCQQSWRELNYQIQSPNKQCKCLNNKNQIHQFQGIDQIFGKALPLSILPKKNPPPKIKNKRLQNFIDSNSGCSQSKIRIQSQQCTIALSTRILYKLYPVYTHNPSAFTIKIVQRYPQLQYQDIHKLQECLEQRFRKQKVRSSNLMQQQENEQNLN